MGRLLHDVGAISAKEVHKNQRDSAAAGKVGKPSCVGVTDRGLRVGVMDRTHRRLLGRRRGRLMGASSRLERGPVGVRVMRGSSAPPPPP